MLEIEGQIKVYILKILFQHRSRKFYFIDDYFLFTGMGSDGVLLSNKTKVESIQIKVLIIKSFNSPFPNG